MSYTYSKLCRSKLHSGVKRHSPVSCREAQSWSPGRGSAGPDGGHLGYYFVFCAALYELRFIEMRA